MAKTRKCAGSAKHVGRICFCYFFYVNTCSMSLHAKSHDELCIYTGFIGYSILAVPESHIRGAFFKPTLGPPKVQKSFFL